MNATSGIYLTHSNATLLLGINAIDPQFRDETGYFTNEGPYPWTKEIFDPISTGIAQTGMGQEGSRRWAWGKSDSNEDFPKWDYRRILAHYYSEIRFVGVSPNPPDSFRGNIVEVVGISPNGNLTMCKDEERTGINVRYQNVGPNPIPVENYDFLSCKNLSNPQTLLGYHLYHQNGTLLSPNYQGLRAAPICFSGGTIPPGKDQLVASFKIFIPNDPAIIAGNTYLIRFDVRRNGTWQGYSAGFPWPPQDIPVTICGTPPGGGDEPGAIIDYPPAVVTYADLVGGRTGFSWSPTNGAETFDVEYRSKEIWESTYPLDFTGFLTNTTDRQFSYPVDCTHNARDWQFRLRGRKGSDIGAWIYVQSQLRVYPLPWFPHSRIGAVVVLDDPGPWLRPANVLNYGGGSFNWSASENQSWIALSPSSGQGQSTFGVTINRPVPLPGGAGNYEGQLTLSITNRQPPSNCGSSTFTALVPLTICQGECLRFYLPVISKD